MIKRPRQPLPRRPEGERLWLPEDRREPEMPTPLLVAMVMVAVPAVAMIFAAVYQIVDLWERGIGAK